MGRNGKCNANTLLKAASPAARDTNGLWRPSPRPRAGPGGGLCGLWRFLLYDQCVDEAAGQITGDAWAYRRNRLGLANALLASCVPVF